jgi:hypothetical protein
MKDRCLNPNNKAYARYGGRGITLYEAWLDFPTFISDMGRRPPGRLTIERLNNDKGYEPSNCKWATFGEQHKNHGISIRNTSGFVGVNRDKGKWAARITVDGKYIHIGNFPTKESAAAARRRVARENGFKTDIGAIG